MPTLTRDIDRTPGPVRGLIARPGARKVQLYWSAPADGQLVGGYDVARTVESNVVYSTRDPNILQYDVAVSAGDPPPAEALFIRAVSRFGSPGPWTQTVATTTTEAGAPTDPGAPPGWTDEGEGGLLGGRQRIGRVLL